MESVKIVTPPNIADTKPPDVISNENNPETQRIETGITIAISIAAVGGFCCISLLILQVSIGMIKKTRLSTPGTLRFND